MRIWSLHPEYLDTKGLVALWRETLLAKCVLQGKTKGYRNHPQMDRFRKSSRPLDAINHYLNIVYNESLKRGYHFDAAKFNPVEQKTTLRVTRGQLAYEYTHLLAKLRLRDPGRYALLIENKIVEPHPLFIVVNGDIENWEVIHD